MGECIGSADTPDSHQPYVELEWSIIEHEGCPYIVFQLKCPSYLILRRYGSLVKSTLPSNDSNSGKNSWKLGASSDTVEKTNPVGVTWERSFLP